MSFLTYETAKQGVDSQSRKMLKFCNENKISGCKLLVNVKTQNDVTNVVIVSTVSTVHYRHQRFSVLDPALNSSQSSLNFKTSYR